MVHEIQVEVTMVKKARKAKKKTPTSKENPPGTPPQEDRAKADVATGHKVNDEDDDDEEEKNVYRDCEDNSIRKYMDSVGLEHMSVKEWMQSINPDLKEYSRKKKEARNKVRGKPKDDDDDDSDDDDSDDDDIYVDDAEGTFRKAMEEEGNGHMSIKDWLASWRPPSKVRASKKDVRKKGANVKESVEVSSASADDDSGNNVVPKNVKTGVPKNVKADERVSTPSGSSLTSSVQSVLTIEDEATKRRIDFWWFRFNKLEKKMKELEEENVDLKRKTSRGGGRTKTVLDPTDRQLLDEAKQGMKYVSRHVKFQKPGWLSFSMRQGTVCQMIIKRISWQP
eukprot:scaffold122376_cov27-Cyclotella_meneghiniana.AAC.2